MSSDNFWAGGSVEASERRRAEARQAAAAQARAEAAQQAELRSLFPRAESGDVPAMRRVAHLLAEGRGFVNDYRSAAELDALGVGGYFWFPKTIVVAEITDFESFAAWAEEYGHGVAGPCPGVEPHRPDPSTRRWTRDLACETAAQRNALEALPFMARNVRMFRRMRWSLGFYLRTVPASRESQWAAERLISFETYATAKNEQVLMQHRLDLVNQWTRDSIAR